tara:strand:+ start:2545 stop:4677 length:2133 start_codon:yes stop_codon:yes gene_type:complete
LSKFSKENILIIISFFFLEGIFFVNLKAQITNSSYISSYKNKVNNRELRENYLYNINSSSNYDIEDLFKNALDHNNNKLIRYLANNEVNKIRSVDITSDTQYRIENKFYAEGNVIVNLSNAELRGDKLIFDQLNNEVIFEGNIKFSKGKQFFEANYLRYNFHKNNGLVKDIFGIISVKDIENDLIVNLEDNYKKDRDNYLEKKISKLKYEGASNIALENSFSSDKKFNITDADISLLEVNKWRFKSDKMIIRNNELRSELVYFTNDPFNKPQLKLKSNDFVAAIQEKDNSFSLISKSTWINLDDKLSFPIGRQSIRDVKPVSSWSIGSDFEEKDGYYISRNFNKKVFNNYDLNLKSFLLIQRIFQNSTNAFPEKGKSILSEKVKNNINFADYFALEASLDGNLHSWNINLDSSINTLNTYRLPEASRLILTLQKSINLMNNDRISTDNNNNQNLLNIKFYNAYRKKIDSGFSGKREIYYAKGLTLSNNRLWSDFNNKSNLILSYDIGEFNSKARSKDSLEKLIRNSFLAEYIFQFPVWTKKNIDKKIDISYKYIPQVIKEGILWNITIDSGIFIYGDNSNQKVLSLKTGPEFTLGSYKKKFFDYTKLNLEINSIFKEGVSPFYFDNLDETERIKINLDQQLYGPILINIESYLIFDNNSDDYGKFTSAKYGIGLKRRAYSVEGYYDSSSEAIGFNFQIYNFDYDGISPKF